MVFLCYNADMERYLKYKITEKYDGERVLTFLKDEIEASARLIRHLKNIPDGITCNGEHIRTVDILHSGDLLCIHLPEQKDHKHTIVDPMPYDLTILYEDDDLLIVDKPAGLPLHPSHNHQGDTLANAVSYYLQQHGKEAVFRSVGRLDRGTSGVVICALNKYTAARLSGKVYKEYYAVCEGIYEGEGVIDKPIYRPDPILTIRTVDPRGEQAITEWKAVSNHNGRTLLHIHLVTGRTHQIRVHFSSMGTPLVGDTMYGTARDDISRQALHCCYCRFNHPVTNEEIEVSSPLPDDIAQFVK